MARLLIDALRKAGYAPELASELRARLSSPGEDVLDAAREAGRAEAERLIAQYDETPEAARPRLWFTYHLYYRAPDHVGPRVAGALGVPYAVAEASRAPKRLKDDWAEAAGDAEAGIDLADVVFCMTDRDRPALEAGAPRGQEIIGLAPFLEPGAPPPPRTSPRPPYRLLTVAMMREGDKLASFRTLAAALKRAADAPWRLDVVGDGPARAEVMAALAPLGDRVRLRGRLEGEALEDAYRAADLFVWPGVGEAFGMVYLEAKRAGVPVLAEDRPGVRDVAAGGGYFAPKDDPEGFARALRDALADATALERAGRAARRSVETRHSLTAAAGVLREALGPWAAPGQPEDGSILWGEGGRA